MSNDEWMNDPVSRKEFDRVIAQLDIQLKPILDAMAESENITEKDLSIVFNARD